MVNIPVDSQPVREEVTLESLAQRMDMFGAQMNWLCENLAELFKFVNAMSASGGSVRGMMKALKNVAPPEVQQQMEEIE